MKELPDLKQLQCRFCGFDSNSAHSATSENQNTESHPGQLAVLPNTETVSSAHPVSMPDKPNGTAQTRRWLESRPQYCGFAAPSAP